MGKLKQGILGGFTGKVSNVVGTSWKGIAVVKARPMSVANPRTASQVAQREKFAFVGAFASAILSIIIKPLWDRFHSGISGYNAFIRMNIEQFASAVPTDPSALIISSGKMASTACMAAITTPATGACSVVWTNDAGQGYKLATDEPFVVLIEAESGKVVCARGSDSSKTRASEGIALSLGMDLTGKTVYAYLAFRRADGSIVSGTAFDDVTHS